MRQLNRKVVLAAAVTVIFVAAGLFWLSEDSPASAQERDLVGRRDNKVNIARADQLAFALRLGTAADYTVFGAKGVKGDRASVEGKLGSGLDEASLGENGSGLKARSDLNKGLAMIKQLPCQEMEAALTGGTFGPGVYCAPSAALAGQLVLDASGDAEGRFVFLIDGAMKSADNFRIDLTGGAKAGNVYFVADTASLGAWNTMSGSVIARGTVDVGAGTTIKGRAISKESEVILADGANLAMAPGYIQICKYALRDGVARTNVYPEDRGVGTSDIDGPVLDSLRNRIFRFSINGGPAIQVPVGQCSNPILVNDATAVVEELIDGFYLHLPQTTANMWFNRFRLVHVSAATTDGSSVPTLTTNLETRQTSFAVPTTGSSNPVILNFTNTFAIPAVIEICKYSAQTITTNTGTATTGPATNVPIADVEVSGFFDFTVNVLPGRIITIPVGSCSGPIQLLAPTIPQPAPGATPAPPGTTASATVYVTELAESGFTLEEMNVLGGNGEDRQVPGTEIYGWRVRSNNDCAITTNLPIVTGGCTVNDNPGGGYQGGFVYEASNASDQTIFNFFNRTNPGIIKICKIAGPGVPVGTRFEFEVRGRQAQFQATGTGNLILPGQDVTRRVIVNAGPAEQGGFCSIVTEPASVREEVGLALAPGDNTLFIVGTLAYVREVAVLDDVPRVQEAGFGDTDIGSNVDDGSTTDPASQVRVSRITVNGLTSTIPAGPQTVQGNVVDPNPNLANREVIFRVNRGETVVSY